MSQDAPVGITVPRRFTTAGADPFEGISFVRRRSAIFNTDGSVIFEMNDVEVPNEWTQVAVDILVSKYFRKAGVPQVGEDGEVLRDEQGEPILGTETSARQWALRLSNAWRIWGERGGYFASPDDAQAFRDELAYMLMTQMGSPNSPQHFNTGLFEAYGIVADPEGNWYVDPETGETKESTHRYERSAVNACFPAGTRVMTRGGSLPIEKIEPGVEVLTHAGHWQAVRATMQRQIEEDVHTFSLSRMTARPFTATSEHPVLALRSAQVRASRLTGPATELQPAWVPAKDLNVGDFVVMASVPDAGSVPPPVDLAEYCGDSPYFAVSASTIRSTQGRREFSRYLSFDDPAVMRLLGRWVGDGSYDRQHKGGALSHVRFTFDSAEEDGIADVAMLMEDLLGVTSNLELAKGQNTAHLRYGVRPFAEWMLEAFGSGFASKTVPSFVMNSPREHRVQFLAGLWSADGCLGSVKGRRYLHFDNSNLDLAEATWRLLRSLAAAPSLVGGRVQPLGTTPHYRTTVLASDAPDLAKALGVDPGTGTALRGIARLSDGRVAYRVNAASRSPFYGTVYNFSVAEDETYVVENAVVHNCFILNVDDELVGPGSIFNFIENEARLFKSGSGSGANLSKIRGKGERLSGGGTSSGVMSFMRVADRAAGAIKSGGTTRRAAKMVILDADHPEIEDFIWSKVREEEKVAALVAGGFSSDWNGEAYDTVSFQNGNNSVRLPEGFMEKMRADAEWELTARRTGEAMKSIRARKLWDDIAHAAWQCADPGVQFDDLINDWHTAANDGRQRGTNPCFTGDTLVHTDKGLVRFDQLLLRTQQGESFGVYTHDATNPDAPSERIELTTPKAVMVTGVNDILRLEFSNGMALRCTPGHRIWTTNRGYVEAQDITPADQVKVLNLPTPATAADLSFPVPTDPALYNSRLAFTRTRTSLPEKWTPEFAHYLGWLVGDGCVSPDGSKVVTVYGGTSEAETALPPHKELLEAITGSPLKVSVQANGTSQLRINRAVFRDFLGALGVSSSRAPEKSVPAAVLEAPPEILSAFLRGLYDADGCAVDSPNGTRYVGLGSASPTLLRDVQRLLSTFGITSSMYSTRKEPKKGAFSYVTTAGNEVSHDAAPMWDLRLSGRSLREFAATIGFSIPEKASRLQRIVSSYRSYAVDETVRLTSRTEDGFETTYNLSEPRNHSYVANGVVVRNCSEYLFLDNTACNLASLNLVKYFDDATQTFDVEAFKHAVRLFTIVLEISVSMSHYPAEVVARNSFEYRTLGLGYANLGALLMRAGLPYDSPEGLAAMGALTALMHDTAYAASAELAAAVGPCIAWGRNVEPMSRVLRNHARAALGTRLGETDLGSYEQLTVLPQAIDHDVLRSTPFANLSDAVVTAAQEMLKGIAGAGYRNCQVSVEAPTGTIGLQMDCDTTGIEPDFALVKFKKLAGGGYMKIVNNSVRPALKSLGYEKPQIRRILAHAIGTQSLDGPTAVNRGSLLAKGLPARAIDRVEAQLKAVTELSMAFSTYVVGTDVLEEIGLTVEEYTAPEFNLLEHLGYSKAECASSSETICGHGTIEGAADLKVEHLPVFDTANYCGDGTRVIAWEGHVRALGAVAPHLSGSASKTINLPNEATVDEIRGAYELSYDLGVKCAAVYRDGSKLSQVLSSQKAKEEDEGTAAALEEIVNVVTTTVLREIEDGESPSQYYHGTTPPKFKLPSERVSRTWKFTVGNQEVFLTAGQYDDGTLGEVWITLGNGKEGTLTSSILHSFAVSISMGLQYGVPLERFVDMFVWHSFQPAGVVTGHKNLKMATSIMDAIFKILAFTYLGREDLVQVADPKPRRAKFLSDGESTLPQRTSAPAVPTALSGAASGKGLDLHPVTAGTTTDADPAAHSVETRQEPGRTQTGSMFASGEACANCGGQMVKSGTCSRCLNCGETSGCS